MKTKLILGYVLLGITILLFMFSIASLISSVFSPDEQMLKPLICTLFSLLMVVLTIAKARGYHIRYNKRKFNPYYND